MAPRPARLRQLAVADIEQAVEYLRGDAGDAVAMAFIGELERNILHIARSPNSVSLRFAHELGIPELRAWALKRFPFVIFYVGDEIQLDIWRVLHGRRDIPATFSGDS